jgi:hypothetical protein
MRLVFDGRLPGELGSLICASGRKAWVCARAIRWSSLGGSASELQEKSSDLGDDFWPGPGVATSVPSTLLVCWYHQM